jgi:membrane associated rhomboid family serine protease
MNLGAAPGGTGPAAAPGASQLWFEGATITKALSFLFVVSFVIVETNDARKALELDFQTFLEEGDTWRLFTCHFPFGSFGELLFGLVFLVPLSRKFEREVCHQLGS